MTISAHEAKELKKRIRKLVDASLSHSLKGTGNEVAHADTEGELRIAKKRLNDCIDMLRMPDGRIRP